MKTVLENIWMYLRYFLLKVVIEVFILWIVGFLTYWLAFIFRQSITEYPNIWKWLLLYWVSNSDEDWGTDRQNYLNNWYGVYELVEDEVDEDGTIIRDKYEVFEGYSWIRKFLISYHWGAFRNWTWNTKRALGKLFIPHVPWTDVVVLKYEGGEGSQTWRNKWIFGIQKITGRLNGVKHFRYSFTLPLERVWLGRILIIFNKRRNYFNFMIGTDTKRYLFKMRWFEYRIVTEIDDDTNEEYQRVSISCDNCSTIHCLEDNAEKE